MKGQHFIGTVPRHSLYPDRKPVKQASTPKYNINTCLNRNARAYRVYLTKVAAKTAKRFSNIPRSTNIYQIGFRKQRFCALQPNK